MKYLILLLSFLVTMTSCEMKEKPQTQENVKQTILTLERQALDQWAKGDPVGFSKNFAKDVTYFDDIAAHNRVDGLEEAKDYFATLEGKVPVHKYELVEPKVQVYNDIAILTMQYHSTMPEGEPGPPWKSTIVYHLNNGEWQVVHAHWSLIKEQ